MIVIVNFKTYATGKDAVKLAKICERVAKKEKKPIAIAVQTADIFSVAASVSIPVLAQHVDPVEKGAHTGSVIAESFYAAGAAGSLVNHSEKRISLQEINKTVKRLRKLGMISIVCVKDIDEAKKIDKLKPDMIALEPPELIGGNASVSDAKPDLIRKAARAVRVPLLCGAGIHSRRDVARAIELGAQGILVAHAVVCAENPKKVLAELAIGLK